jgi:aspartokinase
MVTVSHLARKLLENKPFLLEGLSRGIISYGNLADELKPKIEKELGRKVKDAAIVMSLRRYAEELSKKSSAAKKFNFSGELMIKTNICDFNVVKTPHLLSKLKLLYSLVDLERGDFLNIILGNNEVSIAINEKHETKVARFLKDEKVLNKESNLVALTIIFSDDFIHTPGIVFQIVRRLAWDNINIFEIISTLTELTFIISKKDSMRAYEVLEKIVSK